MIIVKYSVIFTSSFTLIPTQILKVNFKNARIISFNFIKNPNHITPINHNYLTIMDLKDKLRLLSEKIISSKERIQTEEATKNAFIMPFLQYLGYDVFDPNEVVPEYVTDIGTKKGEKIDYAICKEGQPLILIECKHWKQNLSLHDNQLLRYFHVSKAKFGILTNGIIYRFYTDLIEPNKMDEKPFFEINIEDFKDSQVEELKKFHKSYFDISKIIETASELKYTGELKSLLLAELSEPTENFTKHFAKQVYQGVLTQKIVDQFTYLLKKSSSQMLNEYITDRLQSALTIEKEKEVEKQTEIEESVIEDSKDKKALIVTTEEELEGFYIIKSIIREVLESNRITYRDAQSYFAIFADDNNRRPIARLYFNSSKKSLSYFDADKKETKVEISKLDDIYNYRNQLLETAKNYS